MLSLFLIIVTFHHWKQCIQWCQVNVFVLYYRRYCLYHMHYIQPNFPSTKAWLIQVFSHIWVANNALFLSPLMTVLLVCSLVKLTRKICPEISEKHKAILRSCSSLIDVNFPVGVIQRCKLMFLNVNARLVYSSQVMLALVYYYIYRLWMSEIHVLSGTNTWP